MRNVNVPSSLRWLGAGTNIRAIAPHGPYPTTLDKAEYISYGMLNAVAARSAAAAARFANKFTTLKQQAGDPDGQYPLCYAGGLGHVVVSAGRTYIPPTTAAVIVVPHRLVGAFYTFYRDSDRGLRYGLLMTYASDDGTVVFVNIDRTNDTYAYWVTLSARGAKQDVLYTEGLVLDPGDYVTLPWAKKVGANAELVAQNADMFSTASDLTTPYWGRAAMLLLTGLLPAAGENATVTVPFTDVKGLGMWVIGAPAPDSVAGSAAMPYIRGVGPNAVVIRNPKRDFDAASFAGRYSLLVVGEY